MLHEVLLALSGHPSPLYNDRLEGDQALYGTNVVNLDFPDLSSSEAALLQTVGRLSILHRQLRELLKRIVSAHDSTVCRAVAASLLHTHLARFQDKILRVEEQILTKDPRIVGAYNIVPLSGVVGEFDEWTRRITWYWKLSRFISGDTCGAPCSTKQVPQSRQGPGAALIDHLRGESKTGFPDI